ncbi:DUF4810 domain-containing protein [Propionivibrio sp.]|uniref:DUF4810 domain-containing protein n=1 Tax=Propionivibrio sp. TaxID=2212460 RepID=UPI0025DD93D5|nr:DUF4810 domain-containing protein [Propionivibrio sp.]MBK7355658.1 DUF4810 domain-containing protein [Propionivibrio sp.]MBK8400678.1 DUF4810 domain-containing protein [Propionivibrio sp.]MBK8893653.1 DUF4810 domain-containing protein [Propionivibrio sp.]MBL0207037.1 DUF4810 domain-containing protein [Propionivibrio sp.]
MRLAALLILAIALSGCVTTTRQYEWGDYDSKLYASYKDPSKTEALTISLENHINQLEQNRMKPPPGLYAELGTLYLQAGSQDKAITMYGKERDAWPESKGLMDAMIKNLERRKDLAEGNTKS